MTIEAGALPGAAEIVVIGAGIAGLSAALFLSRAGREVVILERDEAWGDASGANAGTLSVQVKRLPVMAIGHLGFDVWRSLGQKMGVDTGFTQTGGLRVATGSSDASELRDYARQQAVCGYVFPLLEGNELRDRAPWLGPAVTAATYCAADGYSNPLEAGPALIAAATAAGARLCPHAEVRDMAFRRGKYRIETEAGELECRVVVIAAGPWSANLARMLGFDLTLYADVNMLTVTEPAPAVVDIVITHIAGTLSIKQHRNGTCLIGGGWQGRGGFRSGRREVDYERLLHNLRLAVRVVPALSRLRLVRSWAGFEAVAPDALPVLGRVPGHANAFLTTAARGGYNLGPVQGLLISELIADEETSVPVTDFDPGRFVR